MKFTNMKNTKILCLFLVGLSTLCLPIYVIASEYDIDLNYFEFDIEVEAMKQLNEKFNAYEFAKTLKISEPLFPPKLTPEQVNLKIEDTLQKILKKNYPKSRYEEFQREAEEKYTMYQVGQQVSIRRQYGGQQLKVSGLLEVVTNEIIKISGTPISPVDIDRDDLARLYLSDHETAIAKYVRTKTHIFDEAKKQFIESEKKKIARRIWRAAGYRKSKRSGRWVSVMDVFLHQYEKSRKKKLELLRKEARKTIYQKNGYVFVEAKGGWIPGEVLMAEKEAEQIRNMSFVDRMKGFFKKKSKVDIKEDKTETSDLEETEQPDLSKGSEDKEDLWDDELFSDDEENLSESPKSKSKATQKPGLNKKKDTPLFNEDVSDLFDEDDN